MLGTLPCGRLRALLLPCHVLAALQNASTPFGAFLDPVADKLMVAAVLILLSTQPLAAGPFAGNTWFVPVATLGTSHWHEHASLGTVAEGSAVAVCDWNTWHSHFDVRAAAAGAPNVACGTARLQ